VTLFGHSLGGVAIMSFYNSPHISNFVLFDPTLYYADKDYRISKPTLAVLS